jgi:hypothetical protein
VRYEIDENGCWNWLGYVNPQGYGMIGDVRAHRASYELLVGRILTGFYIHHECRNQRCINPEHLQALPVAQHQQLHNPRRDSCIWGHPFDAENTYITKKGGRQCRRCKARRERERNRRLRSA